LNEVLSTSRELEIVYKFRVQLQDVWGRAAANHETLVVALKEWCAQAEATGIKALQDFARSLRYYTPVAR
jgi:stearoyl-CoA desaturase (delta-9 desaturase)